MSHDDRWQPVPVPKGNGRHDIGDDVRAVIVARLIDEWSRDRDLQPEKVRQLAMWAGASVRALLHELGTLRDLTGEPQHGNVYIPERDGRRCVNHPKGDHELVCLTCLERGYRGLSAREKVKKFVRDLLMGERPQEPGS